MSLEVLVLIIIFFVITTGRNEEFLRLAHSYTEDVIRVNTINKFLPGPLKS